MERRVAQILYVVFLMVGILAAGSAQAVITVVSASDDAALRFGDGWGVNDNWSGDRYAMFGRPWGGAYVAREMLKFNLPTETVSSATLYVYMNTMEYDNRDPEPVIASVFRITESWAPSQVTWNSRSTGTAWATAGGSMDGTPVASSAFYGGWSAFTPHWVAYDISSVVAGWQAGTYGNYGLVLDSLYPYAGRFAIDLAGSANSPYVEFTTVPEPATLGLSIAGIIGLLRSRKA